MTGDAKINVRDPAIVGRNENLAAKIVNRAWLGDQDGMAYEKADLESGILAALNAKDDALRRVFEVGHDDDCLLCGMKDYHVLVGLGLKAPAKPPEKPS